MTGLSERLGSRARQAGSQRDHKEAGRTSMSAADTVIEEPTPELEEREASGTGAPRNLNARRGIAVTVQIVLGSTTMPVSTLMKMQQGSVITLEQAVGEPVDIAINGRVIARGEVVVADEESSRFGGSLTELVDAPSGQTG